MKPLLKLLLLASLTNFAVGCVDDDQNPKESDPADLVSQQVPERSGAKLRQNSDEVECLTIRTEVNVINARGDRRVEPDGVSFLTNSGVARIESAGQLLHENVRIVDGCGDEELPEPESASDGIQGEEPIESLEALALPIPGGGVITASAASPAAGVAGGGAAGGGAAVGGGAAGGGAIGSAALGGATTASSGSDTSGPSIASPSIASPSIPGN